MLLASKKNLIHFTLLIMSVLKETTTIQSHGKHNVLIYNNYKFYCNKHNKKRNKLYWYCMKRLEGCPAYIHTNIHTYDIEKKLVVHNHGYTFADDEHKKRIILTNIMKNSFGDNAFNSFKRYCLENPYQSVKLFAQYEEVRKTLNAERIDNKPAAPINISGMFYLRYIIYI